MKKRNHTYQIDGEFSQFNINASISRRSKRNCYHKLRPSTNSTSKIKKNDATTELQKKWLNTEPDAIAIADELSTSELKTFSFRCIEAMSNLADFDKGQTISQTLENLVREKLPAFIQLIEERSIAKNQYQESLIWSKQFIRAVQPLIKQQTNTTSEVAQLTEQAVHCIEKRMLSKYSSQTLSNRINNIIESIPNYIEHTGKELLLPKAVMKKVATHVKQALQDISNS